MCTETHGLDARKSQFAQESLHRDLRVQAGCAVWLKQWKTRWSRAVWIPCQGWGICTRPQYAIPDSTPDPRMAEERKRSPIDSRPSSDCLSRQRTKVRVHRSTGRGTGSESGKWDWKARIRKKLLDCRMN